MKKLLGLGLLAALGVWLWRGQRPTVTFTVLLENLPPSIGLTVWDAYWWDGSRLVPNRVGLARPVAEAALFQDVAFVPGSFVLATVMLDGIPVQQAASIQPPAPGMPRPNPVNFAGYAFNWQTMILRLL